MIDLFICGSSPKRDRQWWRFWAAKLRLNFSLSFYCFLAWQIDLLVGWRIYTRILHDATGNMAGSSAIGGGGSGFLCLPSSFLKKLLTFKKSGATNATSTIGGIRLKLENDDLYTALFQHAIDEDEEKYFKFNHHEPLCSVCYRPGRSTQLMIPGMIECAGQHHQLEYSGYLMAANTDKPNKCGRPDRVTREYICLSSKLNVQSGSSYDSPTAGKISPVQTKCEDLPCTKTEIGVEVPCSVCTI